MTTTPAPLDLDSIRRHIQLAEDWAEYGHVGDPNWHVARTLIKQVPALLDELAKTRRERDSLARRCAVRFEETQTAERERDAAREELATMTERRNEVRELAAKREAELIYLRAQISRATAFCQGVLSNAVAPTEYQAVMAREVLSRLANPATTAEPAACICATWREETAFGPQAVTGPDATCLAHGEKAEPAAEPKATCGAVGPDLPFIACTYPPGHPPIPIDVRGVGMRDMDHGNDREYRTWWNGRTALVHGDARAQQNRMVSAENAAIVLDDPTPRCHLPVQNGEPCGLLTCRKHGCRVAPQTEPAAPKADACNGNCVHQDGEVVINDLCCPLHGVDAEPAAS